MAEQKKTFPTFTSSAGTLVWPKLTEPDFGNNDYPKPDGEYSTKVRYKLGTPECDQMIKILQPLYDEAVSQGIEEFAKLKVDTRKKLQKDNGGDGVKRNDFFTTLYDEETEEPTGEVEFKFAMVASGTIKKGPRAGNTWKRSPALFDAFGQPITGNIEIWSGTRAKVNFTARPYFIPGTGVAGLKLALNAVQIIQLASANARTASQYGFGEEEGGFQYEASAETDDENTFSDESSQGDTSSTDATDF